MIHEYESELIKKSQRIMTSFCREIVLKRFDDASVGFLLRRLMYHDREDVFQYLHVNRLHGIVLREMLPKGVFEYVVNYRWEEKVELRIDRHTMVVSNVFAPGRPFLRHRVFEPYTLERYTEWFRAYALVPNIVSVFNIQQNMVDLSFDNKEQLKRVIPVLPSYARESFAMAMMLQLTMAVFHSQIVNTGRISEYKYLSPEFIFFGNGGMVRLPIPDDESPMTLLNQSMYVLSSPFLAPERRSSIEDFLEVMNPVSASAMWSIGAIAVAILSGMNFDTRNCNTRLKYQRMVDRFADEIYEQEPFYQLIRKCLRFNPYDRITPQEALAFMFSTKHPIWHTNTVISVESLEKELSHGRNTFYKSPLEWKDFIQTTMRRNKASRRMIMETLDSL